MTKETPSTVELSAGSDPRAVLETVLAGAHLANPVRELQGGREYAMIPEGFTFRDVSSPHLLPPYVQQAVTLDTRDALTAYINRFSTDDTVILADIDAGAIHGLIDYHAESNADWEPAEPRSMKHRATLRLRDSEEFKRWNAMQGPDLHSQAEFAAFLEENSEDIFDPEPTTMIEISRDLEATRDSTFKSSVRLENGDRGFIYETETRAKNEIHIPREFHLSIPLYQGEDVQTLRCAFRWRVGGGGLLLGFEWRRVEYLRQAFFQQIATRVSEETGRPVFFGRLAG